MKLILATGTQGMVPQKIEWSADILSPGIFHSRCWTVNVDFEFSQPVYHCRNNDFFKNYYFIGVRLPLDAT